MSDRPCPRRIAYLVSRYPAVSHTFVLREVQQLRALGLQVETASVNLPDLAPAAMPAEERGEAARTYYLKRHGALGALAAHLRQLRRSPRAWWRGLRYAFALGGSDPRRVARALAYFTEALMLGRWMAEARLEHLHVHFASAAASVALFVKQVFGVSLSLTVHGPDEFDNVDANWLAQKFVAADFLFCIGQYAKSQVMRLSASEHWHKIEISRLGVDPQRYRPQPRGGAADGVFRILCVGRLTPAKGQHVLLEAVRLLRRAGCAIHLTLVGAGPDESSLRQAVLAAGLRGQVSFTGALNQAQVRAQYACADAFVLPSFAEGIPVVLMEAMASALPCVSSRIDGIAELIHSEQEGILLAPADPVALAQALRALIDDPLLCRRMGRAARARVETDFDLRHNVARLAGLFADRLGSLPC
jgi:colanic acid/amylovoran biosynthesis glycosyltransferase